MLTPLPCPFCGEIPVVDSNNPQSRDETKAYRVCCAFDGCHVRPAAAVVSRNIEAAVKRWNTRYQPN